MKWDLSLEQQQQILDVLISSPLDDPSKLAHCVSIAKVTENSNPNLPVLDVEHLISMLKSSEVTSHSFDLMLALGNLARNTPGSLIRRTEKEVRHFMEVTGNKLTFEKAKERLISIRPMDDDDQTDFRTWSHAMCHAIEAYTPSSKGLHAAHIRKSSVLATPELHAGTHIIVNEAVKRATAIRFTGCLDRIMGGIVAYNLSAIAHDGLTDGFAFRPSALKDTSEVLQLFSGDNDLMNTAFIQSPTDTAFLKNIITCNIAIQQPALYIMLKPVLSEIFDEPTLDNYLVQSGTLSKVKGDTPETRQSLVKMYNGGFKKGFYFDVDDTLISQGTLVVQVAALALSLRQQGIKPTIFTSGDAVEKNAQLANLGFVDANVVSKEAFKGKVLEVLVDDTEPYVQGFAALAHSTPQFLEYDFKSSRDIELGGVIIPREVFNQNCQLLSSPPPAPKTWPELKLD